MSGVIASGEGEELHAGWLGTVGRWLGPLLFVTIWLSPWAADPPLAPAAQRLAAVVVLMGVCWVTQALPFAVTSLLPLVLFPLLGIQSSRVTASSYVSDSTFLYLGGFLLALGIERWGLHRRFALLVLGMLGTGPRGLLFGFMAATGFISMWISNTAATLLMIPIALALLHTWPAEVQNSAAGRRFAGQLVMGIAYAASIGGVATLVGTPTNIAFCEIWLRLFPAAEPQSAGAWMATWTPFATVFLGLAWLILSWGQPAIVGTGLTREGFRHQLRGLGPLSWGERWMLVLFTATAALWIFRTDFSLTGPVLIPGWERWAGQWLTALGVPVASHRDYVSDGTVAMAAAVLLFVIPVERDPEGGWRRLMDWASTAKIPWGVLLLFGGGFATADAFRSTGLSDWFGMAFAKQATNAPPVGLVLAVGVLMIFLTEFTSNVATVNAVLPVLASAAVALEVDPRLLMIPATVCASCGFMMPVGTPPNAIAFGTGYVSMGRMAAYGVVLNLLAAVLCVMTVFWLLVPQLGIVLPVSPASR